MVHCYNSVNIKGSTKMVARWAEFKRGSCQFVEARFEPTTLQAWYWNEPLKSPRWGSDGRAGAPDAKDHWFESSNQQILFSVHCIVKTKIKEKRSRMVQLIKLLHWAVQMKRTKAFFYDKMFKSKWIFHNKIWTIYCMSNHYTRWSSDTKSNISLVKVVPLHLPMTNDKDRKAINYFKIISGSTNNRNNWKTLSTD